MGSKIRKYLLWISSNLSRPLKTRVGILCSMFWINLSRIDLLILSLRSVNVDKQCFIISSTHILCFVKVSPTTLHLLILFKLRFLKTFHSKCTHYSWMFSSRPVTPKIQSTKTKQNTTYSLSKINILRVDCCLWSSFFFVQRISWYLMEGWACDC